MKKTQLILQEKFCSQNEAERRERLQKAMEQYVLHRSLAAAEKDIRP